MLTKTHRIGLFASLLLLISMGLNGQFHSKLKHSNLPNSVSQSDSDKQYFDDGIGGIDETDDIADLDDDDDMSFSSRKKISFEGLVSFDFTQNNLTHFCNNARSKFSCTNFYHLPPSHFISLRVFRI